MLASVYTSALQGFTSYSVQIEADAHSNGRNACFDIIGLGDSAVKEARDRIHSAVKYSGLKLPRCVLVNLAPAELKKEGSSFDLAIAIAILAASKQIDCSKLNQRIAFYGELSLNGSVKAVNGIVSLLLHAVEAGVELAVIPASNHSEAQLVKGIQIIAVNSLSEVLLFIADGSIPTTSATPGATRPSIRIKDLSDVVGQASVKRALAIAAAGGHNLLMVGPPGCGKSMLAERFISLLPALSETEILESVKLHSLMGQPIQNLLAGIRPFRNPHHGISEAGLIGGSSPPRPGEISLAHLGVLFLDEFPEFKRAAIEALRAPLENGRVRVTRAKGSSEFPARFQLLAAMNPCPCGRLGVDGKACLCQMNTIQKYLKRLSQPILDRIDLHLDLKPVPVRDLIAQPGIELKSEFSRLREQVRQARELAQERNQRLNAHLNNRQTEQVLNSDQATKSRIQKVADQYKLSARTYFRFLRVARSIADLEQSEVVQTQHVAEAISYRSLDLIGHYCKAA